MSSDKIFSIVLNKSHKIKLKGPFKNYIIFHGELQERLV